MAGALLASFLVAGVAPVAAEDTRPDGQFVGPGPERLERADRVVTETTLEVTPFIVVQAASFDAVPPLGDETRYITDGAIDRG
jgi:hypothetical protein